MDVQGGLGGTPPTSKGTLYAQVHCSQVCESLRIMRPWCAAYLLKYIFRDIVNCEVLKYNYIMFCRLKGGSRMEYLTVKEVGEKWGISSRMVNVYCSSERIPGAIKKETFG